MDVEAQEVIHKTKELWQKKAGKTISSEEARMIIRNVTGFFDILLEWQEKEKESRVNSLKIKENGSV